MKLDANVRLARGFLGAADALARLEILVAAVKGDGRQGSKFVKALALLGTLSQKEGVPLAIVGGLAAIHHGYERLTKDIDVVVPKKFLDAIIRVAPKYGIKVIWHDPDGWHKLQYGGVDIDVVPEGAKPGPNAPTTIPGPKQLGVVKGTDYAALAGWVETKLAADRVQDRADVVQVMKRTPLAILQRVRASISKVHRVYLDRFDALQTIAEQEKQQERERGGPR